MTKRHLLLRKWGKATTIYPSSPRPIGEIAKEFLNLALQNATEIEQSKNRLIETQENKFIKNLIQETANELQKDI